MAAPPLSSATLPVGRALEGHESLVGLLKRLETSRRRYDCIRGLLADALAHQVRPGPLDDQGWTLLVSSGAAAAKLRQCLPALAGALRQAGWPELTIRIKVSMPGKAAAAPPRR